MQRTQIYLEKSLLAELKKVAKNLNVSMLEIIRNVLKKELKRYNQNSLSQFIDNLEPIESFKSIEAEDYVDKIRNKSRIIKWKFIMSQKVRQKDARISKRKRQKLRRKKYTVQNLKQKSIRNIKKRRQFIKHSKQIWNNSSNIEKMEESIFKKCNNGIWFKQCN